MKHNLDITINTIEGGGNNSINFHNFLLEDLNTVSIFTGEDEERKSIGDFDIDTLVSVLAAFEKYREQKKYER